MTRPPSPPPLRHPLSRRRREDRCSAARSRGRLRDLRWALAGLDGLCPASMSSAAAALRKGAAIEVPLSTAVPSVPEGNSAVGCCGAVDRTSTPGAATARLSPTLVNGAGRPWSSTATTTIAGTAALKSCSNWLSLGAVTVLVIRLVVSIDEVVARCNSSGEGRMVEIDPAVDDRHHRAGAPHRPARNSRISPRTPFSPKASRSWSARLRGSSP
ncbi:hypothetical protein BH09ACT3_BH09ACT3_05070 [soil metagenome]